MFGHRPAASTCTCTGFSPLCGHCVLGPVLHFKVVALYCSGQFMSIPVDVLVSNAEFMVSFPFKVFLWKHNTPLKPIWMQKQLVIYKLPALPHISVGISVVYRATNRLAKDGDWSQPLPLLALAPFRVVSLFFFSTVWMFQLKNGAIM